MKLIIDSEGNILSVYSDKLPARLGTKHVTRASNVEFNETTQEWEARLIDGTLLCHHHSRDEVLRQEHQLITEKLIAQEI